MNPKPVNNPKKVVKKKTTKNTPKITVAKKLPKTLTEEDLQTIEDELYMEAVLQKYHEQMKFLNMTAEDPYNKYQTQETRNDYERMILLLTEYLDSFILLGLRPDGEMMSIEKNRNTRDKAALEKILQNFLISKMHRHE